jgi:hypothetical protein
MNHTRVDVPKRIVTVVQPHVDNQAYMHPGWSADIYYPRLRLANQSEKDSLPYEDEVARI